MREHRTRKPRLGCSTHLASLPPSPASLCCSPSLRARHPPWPRGLSGRCSAPLWHSCMRGARLAGAALGPALVRHPSSALSAGDRGVRHIGVCLSQGAVPVPEQPHLQEGCAAHPTPAVGAVRGPGSTEAHCVPHSPGVGRVPSWRRGSSGPWQRRIPLSEGAHWIPPGLSGSLSASDHPHPPGTGCPPETRAPIGCSA